MPNRRFGATWPTRGRESTPASHLFLMDRLLRNAILLAAVTAGLNAQDAAPVLARLDASAGSFQGAAAQIRRITHTAVLNENSEETGSMMMLRPKMKEVKLLIEFVKPDRKLILFREKKAEIYYPAINTLQIYDLGKQSSLVDQFLLLGFGTPGKELEKSYQVKYLGAETVEGQKTDHIELTPKSAKVREHLKKAELWISQSGYPLQQRYQENSGNHTTITYSQLKINPALSQAELALSLPKDVKREYPNR